MELRETRLTLPLFVMLPRKTKADKKFILNLNTFRNTNPFTLGAAKDTYSEIVKSLVTEVVHYNKAKITFTYYHGNNRRLDKSNPCCIIEKFACDELTKLGFWDDDDSIHVPTTVFKWGGVDSQNPRCELLIEEEE